MSTYLIADLHLHPARPAATHALTQFLQDLPAEGATALYILGDLFEYWLGDDALSSEQVALFKPMLNALSQLPQLGVQTYFQAGNRDFLIGTDFAIATGVTLLPDYYVADLYGVPTLLMHGDLLCSEDMEYQQMRQLFRDPAWQTRFLALPLSERLQQAEALRVRSQASMQHKTEAILDVTPSTVLTTMACYQVSRLIHGHTHRPALHEWQVSGQTHQRYVLGDWYEHGSALRVSARNIEVIMIFSSDL